MKLLKYKIFISLQSKFYSQEVVGYMFVGNLFETFKSKIIAIFLHSISTKSQIFVSFNLKEGH